MQFRRLHPFFIFLVASICYANTLGNGFTQDDAIVITQNQFTKQGLSGVPEILKNDTFLGFFGDSEKLSLVAGGRYRPLSLVIFALEYQIFGESAFAFHLIQVLMYGLLLVLIFRFLVSLFGRRTAEPEKWAFITTLVFGLHPLHTEAVANIKGLDEILALLLSITAFLFMLRSAQKPWHNMAGAVAFFLALLAKESAVTMLGVYALIQWIFYDTKTEARRWKPFFYLIGSLIVYLMLRFSILGASGTPINELLNNPFLKAVNGVYVPFTFAEKLATMAVVFLKYLSLLFLPHPLTNDYYPHFFSVKNFADPLVWLGLMAFIALIALAVKIRNQQAMLAFGMMFFLCTISIYSNLFFPIGTFMSERFAFTPLLGFALCLTVFFIWVEKKVKPLSQVVLMLVLLSFSVKTFTRNQVWKDNFTLFTTDVKVSVNSAKAQVAAGGALFDRGKMQADATKKQADFEASLVHLTKALELYPEYKLAHELKSSVLIYQSRFEEAIQWIDNSLKVFPNDKNLNSNLGVAYREWGKFHGEKIGDLSRSLELLQKAQTLLPEDPETFRLLAVCMGIQGNHLQAIEYFKRSLELDESNAATWLNLSKAYQYAGDQQNAELAAKKADELNPDRQN